MFTAIAISVVCSATYFLFKRRSHLLEVGTRGVLVFLGGVLMIEIAVVLLAAAIAWVLEKHVGLANQWITTAITVALIMLAVILLYSHEIRIERIEKLGRQIRDPTIRESVRARILEMVEVIGKDKPVQSLELLAAVRVLLQGRYYRDALAVLDGIEVGALNMFELELAAIMRLTLAAYMNDKSATQAAYDALPSLSEGSNHAYVRDLCRALVLVRAGDAACAHQLAVAVPEDKCTGARNMVLAHVYTAQQLSAEATRTFDWLTANRGDEGLRWVVDTDGPGSPVAQRMLDGKSGPYR